MTDQQILKLAKNFLEEIAYETDWEADEDGMTWMEFSGTAKNIIQFAQQIRKNTLHELKEWLPESTEDEDSWTYTPDYYIGQADYKQFLIDNLK